MEEEKNKIENQYWNLMKKPIVFASSAFALSIISAGTFYGIIYLMLRICGFVNANMCSPFLHLSHIPITIFDWILDINVILYTFKLREKMSFMQILKISIYYTLFLFVKLIITENINTSNHYVFSFLFDSIIKSSALIFGLIVTFPLTIFGIKIINIFCLKWLEKHT